jgi:hypothetical protein
MSIVGMEFMRILLDCMGNGAVTEPVIEAAATSGQVRVLDLFPIVPGCWLLSYTTWPKQEMKRWFGNFGVVIPDARLFWFFWLPTSCPITIIIHVNVAVAVNKNIATQFMPLSVVDGLYDTPSEGRVR